MDSFYNSINKHYISNIDLEKMMRKGIDAMLGTLDPFTRYRSKEETDEFHLSLAGKFGGVGMGIREIDRQIVVFQVYQGFPADKAGLKTGDVITEIDGISTKGKFLFEVLNSLRGTPGTKLSIKVYRPGEQNQITSNITREEIKLRSVPYYGIISGNTGYIMLTGMTENSSEELLHALLELKQNNTLNGLVIDLRDNTGGYLKQAIKIANFFIDKGNTIVSVKSRDDDSVWYATEPAIDPNIPLVILTNKSTASAAEVLSGAIQDNDRGIIIGEKTFGKGLVGNLFNMGFGAEMVLTIAHYYTPSGRCIQIKNYFTNGTGVETPDSLKKYFKTKNGRLERDAEGIIPDFIVEPKALSPLTFCLIDSFILFKYATQYKLAHPSIAAARQFTLSENEYDNFFTYLKAHSCNYATSTDEKIKVLRKTAASEGYLNYIQPALTNLEKEYKKRKQQDIFIAKKEIKGLLEGEIASRYYYEKGRIEAGFKNDPVLKKAIEIIGNNEVYKKTLAIDK
jgi:carboxyl-terminal processing protease